MHISLFWTGGPYAAAVRKAGEESPTRLICLTNTAGAATRPLPPVPSLSCLLPISRRERLPRCVSWREKRRGWRRRGGGGCQHVCVLICRVCVNIDLPYEQLCHYIILTLFISPFFFLLFDPQFVKDTGIVFQRRASEWFVFWYGSPLPPCLLSFSKSCDPVISRHVCDEIGPLKILKAPVELADFQGHSVRVGTKKAERGETPWKNKIQSHQFLPGNLKYI